MSDKLIVQLLPSNHRYPDGETFFNAVKLSTTGDKPILLDYWTDSIDKKQAKENKKPSEEKKQAEPREIPPIIMNNQRYYMNNRYKN